MGAGKDPRARGRPRAGVGNRLGAWAELARWPSGRLAVRWSCEAAPATEGDDDGRGWHGINRTDAKGRWRRFSPRRGVSRTNDTT